METKTNETSGDSTIILSKLSPLSVAWSVRTDKVETYYLDIRSSPIDKPENFELNFIKQLFIAADKIYNYELQRFEAYYSHIIPDEETRHRLYKKQLKRVSVFGYNSARFDTHFIAKFFNRDGCSVYKNKAIASSSSFKSIAVEHKDHKTLLNFKDAMHLVAGGKLKNFAENFGGSKLSSIIGGESPPTEILIIFFFIFFFPFFPKSIFCKFFKKIDFFNFVKPQF